MTVPEAIDVARQQLGDVLPEFSGSNLQLEELETPPFSSKWRFTFSTTLAVNGPGASLADVMRGRRVSKTVEIDPESGILISVKNASV